MKWQIVPESREEMIKNAFKIGRGGHRGSSAPSSPNQLNYITQGPRDMASKDLSSARRRRGSPTTSPQPKSALRNAHSTPRQGSDRLHGANATMTADGSPLPRQRKSTIAESSFSTFNPHSPTLTSSYLQEEGSSFVTPAPPRIHPKLAPPSTAQRPSQHMPTSSPAPFWKYADIGSTPMKPHAPYEASPSKAVGGLPPQSSSPPRASKSPPSSPTKPQKPGIMAKHDHEELGEADEEQGFDLTKYVPPEQICVSKSVYFTKQSSFPGAFRALARTMRRLAGAYLWQMHCREIHDGVSRAMEIGRLLLSIH